MAARTQAGTSLDLAITADVAADIASTLAALNAHKADLANPHAVTAAQVGAPSLATFNSHQARHQAAGGDPLSILTLAGFPGGTDVLRANGTFSPESGGPPTAHAATHEPGGTDAMAVNAAAATGSLRTLGTSATSAAAGNDARFTDARTALAGTARPTEETTVLTGTVNDYDLDARFTYLRCNNASALVLTGFTVAGGAPQAGDTVIIDSIGTSTAKVAHQNAGSTAANRIITASTNGQIIGAGGRMIGVYDGTTSRWRVVAIAPGAPIAVAYNAADYTAIGGMTWTVDAGDVLTFTYEQRNNKLVINLSIESSSITAPLASAVQVALPGGFTSARIALFPSLIRDNGTYKPGINFVGASGTVMQFFTGTFGNYLASANSTNVYSSNEFEIN